MLSAKINSSFKNLKICTRQLSDLVKNTSCGHWANITGTGVAVFHTHVSLLAILAPLLQKI